MKMDINIIIIIMINIFNQKINFYFNKNNFNINNLKDYLYNICKIFNYKFK